VALTRVAFFLHGLEIGGAQLRTLALAGGLAARGIAVELYLAAAEGPLAARLPPGVAVVDLGRGLVDRPWIRARRRRRVRAVIPRLARRLRAAPPDVLVAGANHVGLAAALAHRIAGRPAIGLALRVSNHLLGHGPADRLRRVAIRLLYPRADALLAVSEAIGDELVRIAPALAGRVRVLPNPVVDAGFAARAAGAPDHPWFAPGRAEGSPPVVLGIGRLAPQKDFATLLEAVAEVARTRPVRLAILGDGPERDRLARRIAGLDLGAVAILPGAVPDVAPWLGAADLFVLSSAWEGMPGALVEAMAAGCPVVATDCPGGGRAILAGGALGPLVPIGDPTAMAAAIHATLDARPDPARLRAAAAAFSVDRAVDAHLAVLAEIAARRAPA